MTFVGRYVFFFCPNFWAPSYSEYEPCLHAWNLITKKVIIFLGNMLLCRFPAFSSLSLQLSLRSSWSLLKGNWNLFTDMCCLLFLKCWQRVKCSYPPPFCPRVALERQTDSDKRVAFWDLTSCNSAAWHVAWRYSQDHPRSQGDGGYSKTTQDLKIKRHAMWPNQPYFPTQLLGKKVQVASPFLILPLGSPGSWNIFQMVGTKVSGVPPPAVHLLTCVLMVYSATKILLPRKHCRIGQAARFPRRQ